MFQLVTSVPTKQAIRRGPNEDAKPNYASLQALRAIAAALVVLFHVSHSIFSQSKYWPDSPFGQFFEFGHSGVDFFFVLSGFIIYAAHRRDIGVPAKLKDFLWKRFRRVYPIYWVVLLMIVPVFFMVPSLGNAGAHSIRTLADSFSLVHLFGGGEILTVSWTLFHEAAFYAVFSMLIINRRIGMLILTAWLACSALVIVAPSILPLGLASYFSPLHVLFGMGMTVAWLLGRFSISKPLLVLITGTLVFLASGAEDAWGNHLGENALALLYGIGSSLVVAGAVELERGGSLRIPKFGVFLGNASYSVYLIHFVAMSVLAKGALWVSNHMAIPHTMIFVVLAISSAGAGIVFHLLVEVPLLAFLNQLKPMSRARSLASTPAFEPMSTTGGL